MTRRWGAVVALIGGVVAGPAMAADLPVKARPPAPVPVSDWTGFYVGADVGARVTDPTWTTTGWNALGTNCALNLQCNPAIPAGPGNYPLANSGTYDGIAARVGIFGGYDWQFAPAWVAGVEGHFGWSDKTVSQTGVAPGPVALTANGFPPGAGDVTSVRTTWDASIRARLGYLITPRTLVYATGGPAWQHVELGAACNSLCPLTFGATASPTSASTDVTKLGYTVGAGAEMKLGGNWTGRAEYTFAHFGDIGFNYAYVTAAPAFAAAAGGVSYATHMDLDVHTFVVGLAYKFGAADGTFLADPGSVAPAHLPFKAAPAPLVAYNWSGFYVGGDVGARVSDPTWSTTGWNFLGTNCALTLLCNPGIPVGPGNYPLGSSGTYDGIGARVGLFGGYDWQFAPSWVAGLEGRFGWGDKTVSRTGVAPAPMALTPNGFPPGVGDATSVRTTWDASIRARLGYLIMPSTLVYVTGGAAWQHVERGAACNSLCPFGFTAAASPTSASTDVTKLGYTVGAGAEMKLWGNWSGRAEYAFAHFGGIDFNYAYVTAAPAFAAVAGGVSYATHMDLDVHTFVVGVAYKFGPR